MTPLDASPSPLGRGVPARKWGRAMVDQVGVGLEPGEAGRVHRGLAEAVESEDGERWGGRSQQAPPVLEPGEVRQVAGMETPDQARGHGT